MSNGTKALTHPSLRICSRVKNEIKNMKVSGKHDKQIIQTGPN